MFKNEGKHNESQGCDRGELSELPIGLIQFVPIKINPLPAQVFKEKNHCSFRLDLKEIKTPSRLFGVKFLEVAVDIYFYCYCSVTNTFQANKNSDRKSCSNCQSPCI
jgi:hypothetical protein